MGVYEIDIYAKTLYGAPLFVSFSTTMRAEQRGYGALEVSWDTPLQAAASQILAGVKSWSRLRLVRNSYGIPDAEDDGWVILDQAAGAGGGAGEPVNTFLDDTVVPGQVYYYAVFVSTAPDDYDAAVTYYPGDLVTHGGKVYIASQTSAGATPDLSPESWTVSGITEQWNRCGGCVGLAVKDFKNGELLYNHIPRPYKVETVESTASSIPVNDQLARFCALFGYFFDVMKCEHNQLLRMNDVRTCTDRQLYLLAQEMGIADRLPSLPELRRTYVRDAALIQRDRGSVTSTAQLVRSITGWDADVLIGYNELHDLDEAAFVSPDYPQWQRDTVYYNTIGSSLYSDIVRYNGELYSAIGTPRRESAYLSFVADTNPTTTGFYSAERDPDRVADPYPGYVRYDYADPGDSITFTFGTGSSYTGASWFDVFLVAVADPAGGIITAKVNGIDSEMPPLDLYSPTRQQLPIRLLGNFNLNQNGNTLTLTVTGKNPLSSGHTITTAYWMIHGGSINLNVPPVGDPYLSHIFWQKVTPGTLKDTLTQANPLTGGYSSWNLLLPDGTINPNLTTSTPDWWISPQGALTGTQSPGDGNSLNYTAQGTAGTREVYLAGPVKASTWREYETYPPGQAVVWNPLSWERTPVYVARAQSVNRQPDTNPEKWELTAYQTGVSPEPSRILADAIHTPHTPTWVSTRSYRKGDTVSWRGHLYEAALPSMGVFPTGYETDNRWWRWLGRDIQRYTFSLYHNRSATSTGSNVRPFVNWFNASGEYGGLGFASTTAQLLFDRFETTPVYPQSTGSAPAGYTAPAAGQQGVPIPWNWTRGDWENTRGVVRPTTWTSTTEIVRKAGRALWFNRDWVYPTVPSGQSGEQVYATFMSAPDESSAVMEHGIVFRYSSTGYWLASRDRLTYTTVTLSGDTVTGVTAQTVASWTPLAYGERMRVRNRAADILVEVLGTAGWRTLANVSDTRNSTATGYGLMERVRP